MSNELSSWKSIAVFLDASPQGRRVGELAVDLAERCTGHLIGIHALPDYFREHPSASFAFGEQAVHEVFVREKLDKKKDSHAVTDAFALLVQKRAISSELRIFDSASVDDDLVANARTCDLLVLGYPRPPGLPSDWSLDRLLIESGGPMLVIPDGWPAKSIGRRMVVAWNASREARRAVRDAIPLLSTAQSVTVLMVDPERSEHKFFEAPGVDLARLLKRHGASVDLCQMKSQGSIADTILSEAFKREVDIVVIGAYSHARMGEQIFGGVTRTLLARARIPLFLSV